MEKFRSIKKLKLNKKDSYGGNLAKRKSKKIPLFTIITVVLNQEKYIEQTIKSLLQQKVKDFEYIIIDGGSTDRTLDIIKKYSKKISYWVSQKDKGIYYAFNKGMTLAKGKYIGILNSDDLYTKNALNIIKRYILKYPEKDFIFGSVKKHWGVLHGYRPKIIKYSWGFYSSHSTGFFIKRKSAKKVGKYNIKYKYHADFDFFYRMIVKKKLKGIATKESEIVGVFRQGGFSSKTPYLPQMIEQLKIRLDNGQNFLLITFLGIFKFFKNFHRIVF